MYTDEYGIFIEWEPERGPSKRRAIARPSDVAGLSAEIDDSWTAVRVVKHGIQRALIIRTLDGGVVLTPHSPCESSRPHKDIAEAVASIAVELLPPPLIDLDFE